MTRTSRSHPEPGRVLRACRRFVKAERDLILEGNCVRDSAGLPRRETLEREAVPHVRRAERILRRIDAALERLARK